MNLYDANRVTDAQPFIIVYFGFSTLLTDDDLTRTVGWFSLFELFSEFLSNFVVYFIFLNKVSVWDILFLTSSDWCYRLDLWKYFLYPYLFT